MIPDSALANSPVLTTINIPDTVKSIADNAFEGCTNFTIYGKINSYACLYAIMNDYSFAPTDDRFSDSDNLAINRKGSDFTLTSGTTTNGYISFDLKYSIKDTKYPLLSNKKIKVHKPLGAELIAGTLKLDGQSVTEYTEEDTYFEIPITSQSGDITFSMKPTESRSIRAYALFEYKQNSTNQYDIIGIINEAQNTISIESNSITNSATLSVNGVSLPDKAVDLYISDEKVATVNANKAGIYQSDITISSPVEDTVYAIQAKMTDAAGTEHTATTRVKYSSGAPKLTEFNMYYGGKVYNLMDTTTKQKVTFILESFHGTAAASYSFSVKFENAENLGSVKVISQRNNMTKAIDAVWDEKSQTYIASGWFDPDNHEYVFGGLNVYYTLKQQNIANSDAATAFSDMDSLSEEWKNAKTETVDNSKKHYEAKVHISDEKILDYDCKTFTNAEMQAYIAGQKGQKSVLMSQSAAGEDEIFQELLGLGFEYGGDISKGYAKCAFRHDSQSIETIIYDATNDLFIKEVVKAASESKVTDLTSYMTGGVWEPTTEDMVFSIGYGTVKNAITLGGTMIDIEGAKNNIERSNMSSEAKQEALKKVEGLRVAAAELFLVRTMGTVLKAAGESMILSGGGLPAGIAFYVLGIFCEDYLADVMQDDMDSCIGMYRGNIWDSLFNTTIDPSGYIYEAYEDNRLEGVTVTAYYRENANAQEVLWNAEEYSQKNPLTTDKNGSYAWDVPEGQWRVKYEKAGYETVYSDWLDVPPPQTGINIGMVSKTAPKISWDSASASVIEVKFTKYMDTATLKPAQFSVEDASGKAIAVDVSIPSCHQTPDGKQVADTVIIKPATGSFSDGLVLTIGREVTSYAGVTMDSVCQKTYGTLEKKQTLSADNKTVVFSPGETQSIQLTLSGGGSGSATCTSDNGSIIQTDGQVTFSGGKATLNLKALTVGNAVITVKMDDSDISLNLFACALLDKKAYDSSQVRVVRFAEQSQRLEAGKTIKVVPEFYPEAASTQTIDWSTGNDKVATVASDGTVTAVGAGQTTITVTLKNGNVAAYQVIVSGSSVTLGDIDGDGKINASDALQALRHSVKEIKLEGTMFTAGDVTKDKLINASDALQILRYSVKEITSFD